MDRKRPTDRLVEREFVFGGITAGLLGGLLMGALEMEISYSHGHGLFAPFRLIDDVVRGAPPDTSHATGAVVGFLIHLAISGLLGGVFAILYRLARRLSGMVDAFWFGPAFAVIVWGAATVVFVLDAALPDVNVVLEITPGMWLLAHVVYGISLGLTPKLARLYYRGEEVEREEGRQGIAA